MAAILVTSMEEVIENVKQFNQDLHEESDIVTQLTMFKHWYYIPQLDLFGPSKYIGYKNMNTSRYNRGRDKTGVDTEKVLKNWLVKISGNFERDEILRSQLITLLGEYDKKLRSNACIHLPKISK